MLVAALDLPFLLLPFRPTSDPSAARTFVRNYFGGGIDRSGQLQGERLMQELRLTEPMVRLLAVLQARLENLLTDKLGPL